MEKIIDLMQLCEERNVKFMVSGFNYKNEPMSFEITAWIPAEDKQTISLLGYNGMSYNGEANDDKEIIMEYKSED